MKESRSRFLQVRGLRYHVREWGRDGAPKVFLFHGFQDVSASFQFLVDALQGDWHVLAPDWRGMGESEWAGADGYSFQHYLADLDSLLDQLQPESEANIVGHSLGGNMTGMYAGVRPERVRRLVLLDAYGLRNLRPEESVTRYRRWLDQVSAPEKTRDYADFAELAGRLRAHNPSLSAEQAAYLAPQWGREKANGRVELRSDPAHRFINPTPFRAEEFKACWSAVRAPVLCVDADYAQTAKRIGLDREEVARRRALFRDLRVVHFPKSGHMLHLECPQQVAVHLEPFLL